MQKRTNRPRLLGFYTSFLNDLMEQEQKGRSKKTSGEGIQQGLGEKKGRGRQAFTSVA